MSSGPFRQPARTGFTLIEILVVVVIMGILAMLVIASVRTASHETREAVLRDELRYIRTQIALYRATHSFPPGIDPDTPAATEALFVAQLTSYTDFDGRVSATRDAIHTYGPYLTSMPTDPITSKRDILLVADGVDITCNGSTGWIYKPQSLEFFANNTEYGPSGRNW